MQHQTSSRALFQTPFGAGAEVSPAPYDPFSEGFRLGFDQDGARLTVTQARKSSPWDSSPDQDYVVSVNVDNPPDQGWLTIEADLALADLVKGRLLSVLLSLKSSVAGEFALKLRLFDGAGGHVDHLLGQFHLDGGAGYSKQTFSHWTTGLLEGAPPPADARILLFLPTHAAVGVTLSMYNVFLTDI